MTKEKLLEDINEMPSEDFIGKVENYLIKNNIFYFKNNFLNKYQKEFFNMDVNFYILIQNNILDFNYYEDFTFYLDEITNKKFHNLESFINSFGVIPRFVKNIHIFFDQVLSIENEK